MRITPYFLDLIKQPQDALARQVIPDPQEVEDLCTNNDPLAEESQSPAPLIIHRYPQRALFLVADRCAVHCRFCMRKRRVGRSHPNNAAAFAAGVDYIQAHREINEVILSGGDPLMLDDATLEQLLDTLGKIPHVRTLRLHTRIPSVWPYRITPELAQLLASYRPLYINIHFNHPREISPPVEQACTWLADAGIPLGSQTVLLKGINDDAGRLISLFEKLLAIRVRPYYLHQLDRVPGTNHFQVPLERSLALVQNLRGALSGMGMPHFMVDLPGGGGKIELLPESKLPSRNGQWVFKNYQGRLFYLPQT